MLQTRSLGTRTLKLKLIHYIIDSLDQWVLKSSTYLLSEDIVSYGETQSIKRAIIIPIFQFIRFLFLKRVFLDGVLCLVVASHNVNYEILLSGEKCESRMKSVARGVSSDRTNS